MKYKAIVFDLDGTAIPNRPDGMPSDRLVQAVAAAKENLHLIAATARPLSIAQPIIQALKLEDPCVICGGTIIIDQDGKVLYEAQLNRDQLEAVEGICKPYPYKIGKNDETYGESAPAKDRTLGDTANIVYIPKVEARDLTPLVQKLSGIPGVFVTSTRGWVNHVIHVTTKDGSKEHGVRYVLDKLGVKKDETIGVGDGDNDIHIFAAVGRKIAMGNASENLKAVADEVAPSVDEDGLAWVIEKYSKFKSVSRKT